MPPSTPSRISVYVEGGELPDRHPMRCRPCSARSSLEPGCPVRPPPRPLLGTSSCRTSCWSSRSPTWGAGGHRRAILSACLRKCRRFGSWRSRLRKEVGEPTATRFKFPDQRRMVLEVRSFPRAYEAAKFFGPILGVEVVAERARVVNRWFQRLEVNAAIRGAIPAGTQLSRAALPR